LIHPRAVGVLGLGGGIRCDSHSKGSDDGEKRDATKLAIQN